AVMNLWFWPYADVSGDIAWGPHLGIGDNLARYARFYVLTSFGWDSFGAVGNALLVIVLGRPLIGALDRAARRLRLEVRPRVDAGIDVAA
ncbi:MAG: hypothetical protein M3161_07375, partial [Actinomycetota bacterium]|nr:hypothetical protein [Actinomycetota bacterium]